MAIKGIPEESKKEDKPPDSGSEKKNNKTLDFSQKEPFLMPANFQVISTNELNGNKKSDLVVYVYNIVEDEWSFFNAISDLRERKEQIERCESYTDCFFLRMAAQGNFVYLSPQNISADFQNYIRSLLKCKDSEVIVPQMKSHQICLDFIKDKKAFGLFVKKAENYKRVVLLSYVASPQFYLLKEALVRKGIEVYTPEAPELDCAWTVNFFGSKSGIRQLAQQSVAAEPDFMMPDGVICVGKFDAAKIAANKYIKQKGVVVKTNKGSGGNGVLIFRENDLPFNYLECEKKIREYLNRDIYWEKFPIIIEDLININYAVGGGFPNVEFKIHKNGRIEMVFYCACMVTDKGAYYGLDINDEIINDRIATRIVDTGYYIAEQYSSAGYRGHFDVDMMAAKNNHIYVCESNTRNTGGTDIYYLASKLAGKDFMSDVYVISRSHFRLSAKKIYTFNQIIGRLETLLYSYSTGEGVIVNSENILKEKELIYTIIGRDKKRAYEIEAKMREALAVS
ncbi:MAG TPA: hypothetical protein VMW41_05970 [Candidatus Bathyarchaeia archaeon]|nr:hypothetical protein [Candidatus Bathyarchaeia archaeon]